MTKLLYTCNWQIKKIVFIHNECSKNIWNKYYFVTVLFKIIISRSCKYHVNWVTGSETFGYACITFVVLSSSLYVSCVRRECLSYRLNITMAGSLTKICKSFTQISSQTGAPAVLQSRKCKFLLHNSKKARANIVSCHLAL